MPVTPLELRHIRFATRLFGYHRSACDRLLERFSTTIEEAWQERDALRERVRELDAALATQQAEPGDLHNDQEHEGLAPAPVARKQDRNGALLQETLAAAHALAAELHDALHLRARSEVERTHRPQADEIAQAERRLADLETEVRRLEALREELRQDYRTLLSRAVELIDVPEEPTS